MSLLFCESSRLPFVDDRPDPNRSECCVFVFMGIVTSFGIRAYDAPLKRPSLFCSSPFCCWQEAKHLRQHELLAGEVHQQSRGVGRRAHGTTARGEEENRYLGLLRMPVTLLMANHLSFFPPLLSINRGIALRNAAPLRGRATQTGT